MFNNYFNKATWMEVFFDNVTIFRRFYLQSVNFLRTDLLPSWLVFAVSTKNPEKNRRYRAVQACLGERSELARGLLISYQIKFYPLFNRLLSAKL